jgi:ribose-phosphate pyrophosphokinase
MMMDDLRVFSGSSHLALARGIADYLEIPLTPVQCSRFSNDNLYVRLCENVRGADVFVVQTFAPPVQDHIFELLMLMDAARSASAARVTAVIPYYSYARSDKKDEPRISISGRLVADLLETAGANRVLTVNLHSPQVHGFFSVPTDHLTAETVLADALRNRDLDDAVVVTPDIGNAKRATHLARRLNLPVAAGNKRRIDDKRVVIDGIVGNVHKDTAIVTDDEVATGGSVLALLDLLKNEGVRRALVVCTHGVFTRGAVERLTEHPLVEEIISTDTMPIDPINYRGKLTLVSVAPLLAEAIRRIHHDESVSALFQ